MAWCGLIQAASLNSISLMGFNAGVLESNYNKPMGNIIYGSHPKLLMISSPDHLINNYGELEDTSKDNSYIVEIDENLKVKKMISAQFSTPENTHAIIPDGNSSYFILVNNKSITFVDRITLKVKSEVKIHKKLKFKKSYASSNFIFFIAINKKFIRNSENILKPLKVEYDSLVAFDLNKLKFLEIFNPLTVFKASKIQGFKIRDFSCLETNSLCVVATNNNLPTLAFKYSHDLFQKVSNTMVSDSKYVFDHLTNLNDKFYGSVYAENSTSLYEVDINNFQKKLIYQTASEVKELRSNSQKLSWIEVNEDSLKSIDFDPEKNLASSMIHWDLSNFDKKSHIKNVLF